MIIGEIYLDKNLHTPPTKTASYILLKSLPSFGLFFMTHAPHMLALLYLCTYEKLTVNFKWSKQMLLSIGCVHCRSLVHQCRCTVYAIATAVCVLIVVHGSVGCGHAIPVVTISIRYGTCWQHYLLLLLLLLLQW